MLQVASIFSGVGTPELALKSLKIPFNTIFAAEIDKYARQTYLENNKNPNIFYKDVKQIDGNKYLNQIDLFVGGSPCQAFSVAGKKEGFEDTRGALFFEYVRLVKQIQPKYFIYENVKGLLSHDKCKTFQIVINSFKDLNYDFVYEVLNTKDYGVPQNRERLYVVGFLKPNNYKTFNFKPKKDLKLKLKDMLDEKVDDKYYLNNTQVSKRLNSTYNKEKDSLMSYDKKFSSTLTVGGSNTGVEDSKGNYRLLTPRECFKLQGFKEDFKLPKQVSNTQLYKQAGNAMSLNVLEMILENIIF